MNKRIFGIVAAGLLTLNFLGCSRHEDGKTIKIGAILSLTGAMAHGGGEAQKGLQLAVEQINSTGGIKGREVKLLVENDNTDSERTVAGSLKLTHEDKVLAIMGPDDSTLAFAARSQVAEPNHVVIISVTGSSPRLTADNPRWFFRGATPAAFQTKNLVKYLVQDKGFKRFAVLSDSGITDQIDAFKKNLAEYNLQPLAVETFKTGQTNFNGPLLNIKSSNPDAIMFIGYVTEGASAITQARNLGMNAQFAGSIGIIYEDFIKVAGASSNGVVASIGFSATNDAAQTQAFVNAYKNKFHENPNHAAAQAYDQVNLIFQAIQNKNISFSSGNVEQDRQLIRDYLETVQNYQGVVAKVNYSPTDHSAYEEVNLLQVVDGKWKVIKHSGE